MFAAVLLATTGFVVLTGTAATSQLVARGVVDEEFRPPYDILVRPAAVPGADGLLPPDQLAAPGGGISLAQWEQIRSVSGVEIAAPLAFLGLADIQVKLRIDITDLVDPDTERQLIKIDPRIRAERGLTRLDAAPTYVYLTRRPLVPLSEINRVLVYTDGTRVDQAKSATECPGTGGGGALEVQPGGGRRQVCSAAIGSADPDLRRTHVSPIRAYQALPDGTFRHASLITRGRPASAIASTPRLEVELPAVIPMSVTAIDPVEEARLVGLDRAVRQGRNLAADETPTAVGPSGQALPVLATGDLALDEKIDVAVSRLADGHAQRVARTSGGQLWPMLREAEGTPPRQAEYDLSELYRTAAESALAEAAPLSPIGTLFRPSPVAYGELLDGSRRVAPVLSEPGASDPTEGAWRDAWLAGDAGPRTGTAVSLTGQARQWFVAPVGIFSPEGVSGGATRSHASLDMYLPSGPTGADAGSRALLGDQPLLPNDNPQGYQGRASGLLTTLPAMRELLAGTDPEVAAAPLGAVRVRVSGIEEFDAVARERVRMVADEINRRTGLDVEILLGSSAVPTTIRLPAGELGRPELMVKEQWTKQGVATQIVTAVDRKNLILLGLLLAVCTLLVGNAVSTAVRGRRRELALLACIGWPPWRLIALILTETVALGLVAGMVGAAIAGPLADLAGVRIPGPVALLCVPVAVLLTAVAGVGPALRAARTRSATALHPTVAAAHRAVPRRTVAGLALANLTRVPARTLAGTASLAAGVGAVTLIAAALWAFEDGMVGSLLGQAVSVQVRKVDLIAVAGVLLFGVAGAVDVMYLNIRERAAEFATLRATGWHDAALNRLVGYEAAGIGVLGAVSGVTVGAGAAALLVGDLDGRLVVVAAAVGLAAVLLASLAGLIPAILLHRLPTAQLLTEE